LGDPHGAGDHIIIVWVFSGGGRPGPLRIGLSEGRIGPTLFTGALCRNPHLFDRLSTYSLLMLRGNNSGAFPGRASPNTAGPPANLLPGGPLQRAGHRSYGRVPFPVLDRGHTNFYEKALFVKGDVATDRSVANATALPCALCFYPHSRGAHALVARCIMGSVFSGY
jgi:hypothetical protein